MCPWWLSGNDEAGMGKVVRAIGFDAKRFAPGYNHVTKQHLHRQASPWTDNYLVC